jgi:hypothetical protein
LIVDDSIYMVTPLKMAVIVELYTEATIRKRRLNDTYYILAYQTEYYADYGPDS